MVNPLARVIMGNMINDLSDDTSSSKVIKNYDLMDDKEEKLIRNLIKGNSKQCNENNKSDSHLSETITIEQLAEKLIRGE